MFFSESLNMEKIIFLKFILKYFSSLNQLRISWNINAKICSFELSDSVLCRASSQFDKRSFFWFGMSCFCNLSSVGFRRGLCPHPIDQPQRWESWDLTQAERVAGFMHHHRHTAAAGLYGSHLRCHPAVTENV